MDRYETRFGIRSVRLRPRARPAVNRQHIRVQGVNNHHDLGALGAAFNLRAAERQLELLQGVGVNAIRLSHNPPAPELLERPIAWACSSSTRSSTPGELKETPLDFHLVFPGLAQSPTQRHAAPRPQSPVRRTVGVGNGVGEQYTGDKGAAVARRLCKSCAKRTRPGPPPRP